MYDCRMHLYSIYFNSSFRFRHIIYVISTSWLALAVVFRLLLICLPELDQQWKTDYISTQLSDLNVIAIWLLLTTVISISVKKMFERKPCVRFNRSTVLLALGVLCYDVETIYNIFATWTTTFAPIVGVLQIFPAFSLVIHSLCQIVYLTSSDQRQAASGIWVLAFTVANILFNVIMILHLITMIIIFTINTSSIIEADNSYFYIVLGLIELFHRIWAIYQFKYKFEHHVAQESMPSASVLTGHCRYDYKKFRSPIVSYYEPYLSIAVQVNDVTNNSPIIYICGLLSRCMSR